MSTIRGELVGGATARLLSMPVSMGYGVLALHALGDQYVSHAILAGLYAATLVPLAALVLGYRGPMIYAPRSMLALLLGSVVLQTIVPAAAAGGGGWSVPQTLTLLFLVILMAGVFQALFGALGVGTLIKYIPAPVMARVCKRGGRPAPGRAARHADRGAGGLTRRWRSAASCGRGAAAYPRDRPRDGDRDLADTAALAAGAAGDRGAGRRHRGVLHARRPRLRRAPRAGGRGRCRRRSPRGRISPAFSRCRTSRSSGVCCPPSPARRSASPWSRRSTPSSARRRWMASPDGRRARAARSCCGSDSPTRSAACFGTFLAGINLGSSMANHRAGGRTALSATVAAVTILVFALFAGPLIALLPRVVIAGTLGGSSRSSWWTGGACACSASWSRDAPPTGGCLPSISSWSSSWPR